MKKERANDKINTKDKSSQTDEVLNKENQSITN